MDEFIKFLSSLSLPTDPDVIHKKLITYQQLLESESNKFNLISHNDLEIIWFRHFFDSLIPIQLFPSIFVSCDTKSAIDIGSGAGFPGLPLALVFGMQTTLLESNQKKCLFLKEISSELELNNVEVICDRAEISARTEHREKYDFAFTRATAKAATALELVIPFIKIGGKAIFWAGGEEWDNLSKLENISLQLGSKLYGHKKYLIPYDKSSRAREIVIFEKTMKGQQIYPRNVGIPNKRPLTPK